MPNPATDATGAGIVATLEATFRKYVALDTGLPLVLALWTLATHVFECFDVFPYLAITSPTKRCGKTRLAEIFELLCCGGLRIVSASAAAIFRMIQAYALKRTSLTLIIDEAEVLGTKSERGEQLREILNAGYRRGQHVARCERTSGDKFEVREFIVYCPKVLVLIGNLEDTLADRCIPVAMRRRRPGEIVGRFFYTQARWHARGLRGEVGKWADASRSKVKRRLRRDLGFLEDREAELWLPLFAVCQVAAPERVEELKGIALRISGAKQSEEPADLGIALLKDIREVFHRLGKDRLTSNELLLDLNNIEESPWAGWSNGKGLDARGLARRLRSFKVEPHNLRTDGQILKGYERADFEEAWATYLPPDSSATPLQPASTQGNREIRDPLQQPAVADEKASDRQQ